MTNHSHRRGIRLVLALLSALAAWGLAEAGLRLAAPQLAVSPLQPLRSSRFHHMIAPSRTMYQGRCGGQDVYVTTNEDGFRTRYSRQTFAAYPLRIAILGDSFAYGHGVRQEHSPAVLLEGKLRQALGERTVAVLNAAEKGYSPFLERLRFDAVTSGYRPNVVVLVLDATDIGDDIKYMSEARTNAQGGIVFDYRDGKPSPNLGAVGNQALGAAKKALGALRSAGNRKAGEAENYYWFRLNLEGRMETNRFFIYRHPLSVTRPYFDATYDNINRIAAACRQLGAEFFLLVSPRYQHWNVRECPRNWEGGEYALNEPFQDEYFKYFDGKTNQANFAIVNLLPFFKEVKTTGLVFEDDPHWTDKGCEFVADVVSRELSARSARLGELLRARKAPSVR
jgi:hypothetical protein